LPPKNDVEEHKTTEAGSEEDEGAMKNSSDLQRGTTLDKRQVVVLLRTEKDVD
jgi:hypothetical protein